MMPFRLSRRALLAASLAVPPAGRSVEVVAIHDVAWRHRPEDYPRRGRRWHSAALRRALDHASRFVVPSDVVARDLVELGATGLSPGGLTFVE